MHDSEFCNTHDPRGVFNPSEMGKKSGRAKRYKRVKPYDPEQDMLVYEMDQ